jgi:DNA polymerase-3 subunit gamma/tau
MDVMEIDGASNRGIDQIRELKSHVGLASFMGGMKVYILDEVHMLTMEAFNALLKTLEEPPPSVMFIFATTEPHKVPVTIRSRCQHIPFHRISAEGMVGQLRRIAETEGVSADESALWELARSADGALRDAISLFEQALAIGHGELSASSVRALLGGGSRAEIERWITQIRECPEDASATLKQTLDLGVSPERFLDGLFPLLRDMWTFSLWGEKSYAGTSLSEEERTFLRNEVLNWDRNVLKRAAASCAALFPRARMGLRNDVFSGLLLLEFMNAFDDPAPQAMRGARDIPSPPRTASPRRASPDAKTPAAPVPVQTRIVPDLGLKTVSPRLDDVVSRLARDDLPMAAALIDVKVFLEGGTLRLDFAEAAKSAEVMLSGTRAAAALESVFGLAPEKNEGNSGGGTNDVTRDVTEDKMVRAASTEAISARLGADILMSRRLDSDDSDTGDIDDEQF